MSAEPAYLYAVLLDVLAYRHYLQLDRESGTLAFQERLSAALSVFDSVNDAVYKVRAISDSLIATCLGHDHFPEMLNILRRVFVAFLEQDLFIRGGVAYSRHFESGRLTYSHAVARAYELEKKSAIYPRIVIDSNILDMYEVGEGVPCITNSGLLCKENGIYFLNVLTADNWQIVYDCAQRIYNNSRQSLSGDEGALAKHLRFERYLLTSPHAPAGATPFVSGIDQA
jgi:hypothetical protein